jgi:hypothetical protein
MCEEESDDHEAVAKLFEINDSIHRTIERYKLMKKGDVAAANAIPKGTLGVSGAGVKKGSNNELSLIDFGGGEDEAAPAPVEAAAPKAKGNALEDDLLGLNMGDGNYGQGGGISLGTSDIMAQFSQPSVAPNSIFASSSAGKSSVSTSAPYRPPPQQQTQQAPPKKADPFASITSPPRNASPFQYTSSNKPPPTAPAVSNNGIDLLGIDSSGPAPITSSSANNNVLDNDEWQFSSALPPDQPVEVLVTNNGEIRIDFAVKRSSETELLINSRISNLTNQPIRDLTFQLAVTKVR